MLAHTCNYSQGGEDRVIRSSMPARGAVDLPSKKKKKNHMFHRKDAFSVNLKYARGGGTLNLTNVDESQKCYLRKGEEMSLTGFLLSSKNK